jgi:hypothetical protein
MAKRERYFSILLLILAMLFTVLLIITVLTAPAIGQTRPAVAASFAREVLK